MKDFKGKIAVVTGAGNGMGKEIALGLAAEGCHLALCDIMTDTVNKTKKECEKIAPAGTRVSCHTCDVSVEYQVLSVRDEVKKAHHTEYINLLFSNAGIGGGGSFIEDEAGRMG